MNDILNELLSKTKSKTSILIKEIDTEKIWYKKDINIQVVSASIIKVPIMLGVLDLVSKGQISLSETITIREEDILKGDSIHKPNNYTIEELLTWMIITSDNTATNALLRTYDIDYFNAYIRDVLKAKDTLIERYMLDYDAIAKGLNNYTSNSDIYKIFKKLYKREILNDDMCQLAINILLRQRDFKQLLSNVYKPYAFAHKTGNLNHINHDVGVVSKGTHYYIGVFIWDAPDASGDKNLMNGIGKTIFDWIDNIS